MYLSQSSYIVNLCKYTYGFCFFTNNNTCLFSELHLLGYYKNDSAVIPRNLFCEVFFSFTCKRNVAFLKIFDPYLGPEQIHMVLKVADGQNYHAHCILRKFNIYTF